MKDISNNKYTFGFAEEVEIVAFHSTVYKSPFVIEI